MLYYQSVTCAMTDVRMAVETPKSIWIGSDLSGPADGMIADVPEFLNRVLKNLSFFQELSCPVLPVT
tara:strand:+ start:4764 stop:4964 length:201 start_codon:yes stop_codon:yes gene_type:complete